MSKINFLRPDKNNLNTFLYLGSFLFLISVLDVFLNSFFSLNLTGFLPNLLSFLLPLILGFIGLYFVRIEYSGIKQLDLINKHINTNNFNAILSLLIIFVVIKSTPPILSWFVIDASFAGDSKDVCSGSGACWTYIKVWMRRFMYGMYPNAEQWRINLSFIALALLGSVGYFATWVGVVLYTSVFISEVVRSGIMAVAKGQSEAGLSLGLRRRTLLRLIVLPQALRIMLPPRPPLPPAGPPLGTNFSLRKAIIPSPPLPEMALIFT